MSIKDGHTDVASAKRQCVNIIEDCQDILKALPEDDEASLPTWWTNKLAVSAAYINSDRDYLVYTVAQSMSSEEQEEEVLPPTAMMVMNGETDAAEKRQESENNIEEHQRIDEETSKSRSKGISTLAKRQGISRAEAQRKQAVAIALRATGKPLPKKNK